VIDENKAYLGFGWSFPPRFSKTACQLELVSTEQDTCGQLELVSAEQDICESLSLLLSTRIGERVMQPTYGCDLSDLMFEPLSPTVVSNIKELIRTAILYHEPRIQLDDILLQLDQQLEGVINICLEFMVLSTNSRFSFVYPFYFQEGSGLT
jgi:uncharacterized protein